MTRHEAIVVTFSDHTQAEDAVRKLAQGGLEIKHFSIIGKGYHKNEQIIGFYNAGDRMLSWGGTGAFWGGLWGIFFGGVMLTVPVVGPIIVLGHLAAMVFGALEGAVVFGGLGALVGRGGKFGGHDKLPCAVPMAFSGLERRIIQDGCKQLVIIEDHDQRAIANCHSMLLRSARPGKMAFRLRTGWPISRPQQPARSGPVRVATSPPSCA